MRRHSSVTGRSAQYDRMEARQMITDNLEVVTINNTPVIEIGGGATVLSGLDDVTIDVDKLPDDGDVSVLLVGVFNGETNQYDWADSDQIPKQIGIDGESVAIRTLYPDALATDKASPVIADGDVITYDAENDVAKWKTPTLNGLSDVTIGTVGTDDEKNLLLGTYSSGAFAWQNTKTVAPTVLEPGSNNQVLTTLPGGIVAWQSGGGVFPLTSNTIDAPSVSWNDANGDGNSYGFHVLAPATAANYADYLLKAYMRTALGAQIDVMQLKGDSASEECRVGLGCSAGLLTAARSIAIGHNVAVTATKCISVGSQTTQLTLSRESMVVVGHDLALTYTNESYAVALYGNDIAVNMTGAEIGNCAAAIFGSDNDVFAQEPGLYSLKGVTICGTGNIVAENSEIDRAVIVGDFVTISNREYSFGIGCSSSSVKAKTATFPRRLGVRTLNENHDIPFDLLRTQTSTYTPVITPEGDSISTVGSFTATWVRIGNHVTVHGKMSYSAESIPYSFYVSLPPLWGDGSNAAGQLTGKITFNINMVVATSDGAIYTEGIRFTNGMIIPNNLSLPRGTEVCNYWFSYVTTNDE